jgi:hypothetical protein
MSDHSRAHNAVLSFMSVDRLVQQRNAEALTFKFLAHIGRPLDRLRALADWSTDPISTNFEPIKQKDFEGITVEYTHKPPAHAIDRTTGLELKKRKKIGNMLLHLEAFEGPGELRARFGVAAKYLDSNRDAHRAPIVGGVTYQRMGRVAAAIGMRQLEIIKINNADKQDLRARHMAHLALSGQAIDRDFKPMALGLPTDEFIEKFLPYYDGRLG